jgi:hypothetical protein
MGNICAQDLLTEQCFAILLLTISTEDGLSLTALSKALGSQALAS